MQEKRHQVIGALVALLTGLAGWMPGGRTLLPIAVGGCRKNEAHRPRYWVTIHTTPRVTNQDVLSLVEYVPAHNHWTSRHAAELVNPRSKNYHHRKRS